IFSDRFRDRKNRLNWTIFRYEPKPLNSKFTKNVKNLTHPHFWLTSRLTGGDYPPIILERYRHIEILWRYVEIRRDPWRYMDIRWRSVEIRRDPVEIRGNRNASCKGMEK